jgi:hypothetical protein
MMMIGTTPGAKIGAMTVEMTAEMTDAMIAAVIDETLDETTAAGVSMTVMTIGIESIDVKIAVGKIDGTAMIAS